MKKITSLSRRDFLSNGLKSSIALTLLSKPAEAKASGEYNGLSFTEIPHNLSNKHRLSPDYRTQILLRWGDPLFAESAEEQQAFDPVNLSPQQQSRRFGYNNDFIGFMPLSSFDKTAQVHDFVAGSGGPAPSQLTSAQHYQSNNSQRGLLCVNHEYTMPHMMFSGYADKKSGYRDTSAKHLAVELQANGHSVVEIALIGDQWITVTDSRYTRRITMDTPMQITGPAAGDTRLQTQADPSGTRVLGTIGNCAGGKTPWGTVLVAEEGFGKAFGFFSDNSENLPPQLKRELERERDNFKRLSIGSKRVRPLGKHYPRFNVAREPREANRFGWMVEYNPYDPDCVPKKRTCLGRFQHEGTTIVAKSDQPIVAYTGDDGKFQFIYKYVSTQSYLTDDSASSYRHNSELLNDGILYVARLNDDGRGEWLPLVHGRGFLTEKHGFQSQADVLIESRRAAEIIGATPMDRPEDIETNQANDCTYVMLTKNHKRQKTSPGNQRTGNTSGHILEFVHPLMKNSHDGKRDHTSRHFQWHTFILGGHPDSSDSRERGFYGTGPKGETVSESGWFTCPDNLAFDPRGNMWVATDGCESFGFSDGLWAIPTTGPYRALPRHFFGCPRGAELCGPEFTPDGKTLFLSVQHPADSNDSSFDQPSHRWPDYDTALPPRPSVVAIRHKRGQSIGH